MARLAQQGLLKWNDWELLEEMGSLGSYEVKCLDDCRREEGLYVMLPPRSCLSNFIQANLRSSRVFRSKLLG